MVPKVIFSFECFPKDRLSLSGLAETSLDNPWYRPGELGLRRKNSSILEKLYLILDLSGRTKKYFK